MPRLETRAFGPGGPVPPVVKALLVANIGVYAFQVLAEMLAHTRLDQVFGLVPHDVTHGFQVWKLATYMFLHDTRSILHVGLNMLTLWMFGCDLEREWGGARFTRFYFVTGIGAGICSVLASWNSYVPIIGASGAIFGLLAAYGILFPDRTLLLYFVLPIKAKWFVIILGVITFFSSLAASGGGVAHVAHLGGMLFGWLYLRFGGMRMGGLPSFDLKAWREARRQEALRKKFRVYYRDTRGDDSSPDEE